MNTFFELSFSGLELKPGIHVNLNIFGAIYSRGQEIHCIRTEVGGLFSCSRQCRVMDPGERKEPFYPPAGAMAEPVGANGGLAHQRLATPII